MKSDHLQIATRGGYSWTSGFWGFSFISFQLYRSLQWTEAQSWITNGLQAASRRRKWYNNWYAFSNLPLDFRCSWNLMSCPDYHILYQQLWPRKSKCHQGRLNGYIKEWVPNNTFQFYHTLCIYLPYHKAAIVTNTYTYVQCVERDRQSR